MASLFPSFFSGGFECASQRMPSGERIDMLAATDHDRHVHADYALLRAVGMLVARDGFHWHQVEPTPGRYDFSSVLPTVRAAKAVGVQVIWDLCHYGWPDDLDAFSPEFVRRCANLARAFTHLVIEETGTPPCIVPVNEISFLSWVSGDVGHFSPFAQGRGYELKQQFVRATIASINAIRAVHPESRIVYTDPAIHVAADPTRRQDCVDAEGYRLAQYQALDMLVGRLEPQLGGHPSYLERIGINYYPHNQWLYTSDSGSGATIARGDPLYRPLRKILVEIASRYDRPVFLAETSSLGQAEPEWLRYVGREVRAALRAGVPVEGICLYPIIDTPDWNDAHHWHQGLWSRPNAQGNRSLHQPLARELRRQQRLVARLQGNANWPAAAVRRTIGPPRRRRNAA